MFLNLAISENLVRKTKFTSRKAKMLPKNVFIRFLFPYKFLMFDTCENIGNILKGSCFSQNCFTVCPHGEISTDTNDRKQMFL